MTPEKTLQAFLYLLMRDQLPTGKVESVMDQIREVRKKGMDGVNFSAPSLALYAAELAEELLQ